MNRLEHLRYRRTRTGIELDEYRTDGRARLIVPEVEAWDLNRDFMERRPFYESRQGKLDN